MSLSGPLVSLQGCGSYERGGMVDALRRLLHPLGGMASFVPPGSRVLFKPNLVFGRDPSRAVNTHPEIFRAAAILAREAGARWLCMGDSPGYGSARAAAREAGLLAVAEEEGVAMVEFTPVEDTRPERPFPRLELAREVLEADVVINLPKLKTHGQMVMTMAVKNMFGAVPGTRKMQWHYRAGRDRTHFARLVNEIAIRARPTLSILDGILAMDGPGPTSGNPNPVGLLAASADPWALDAAILDLLGVDPSLVFTQAAAREHGPHEWKTFQLVGDAPASLRPASWDIPELKGLHMHGWFIEHRLPSLARWLRSRLTPRPEVLPACIACGYCVEICPAKAMRIADGRVRINVRACIRCLCCHELCRHEGMAIRSPGWLAKILGL